MAFNKLCVCGALFVGASSCVSGSVNGTASQVFDDVLDRVAIDSQNRFWLLQLLPYDPHAGGDRTKVVRCDDNWSCTDVLGDFGFTARSLAVAGNGSIVYLQERSHGHGAPTDLKKCIQGADGKFSCSVLGRQLTSQLAVDAQGNLLSADFNEVRQWTSEGSVIA